MFDAQEMTMRAMYLIPLLLSLTVHECAHAWAAFRLGDDTALRLGRLSLNPIVHIDPLGTFLLPMLGIPFGWAKPVPVNPARFRRDVTMPTGMALTAAAGPLSNLALAVLCTLAYGLWWRFDSASLAANPALSHLLMVALQMNVGLALFNLLPIPPLDGSRIVERFMPFRYRMKWSELERLGPMMLIVAIGVGRYVLDAPLGYVSGALHQLIGWLAQA